MITTVNSVKWNGHNSPGQNLTASPWLTQLVSTWEVVTGSEWLQIMYHNITLRKCPSKPNVNPICGEEGGVRGREGEESQEPRICQAKGGETATWRTAAKAAFWQLVKTCSLPVAVVGKQTVIKSYVVPIWQLLTRYLLFKMMNFLFPPQVHLTYALLPGQSHPVAVHTSD